MENILYFNTPAKHFEEAFPLGNGTLGAMVYGGCEKERISLNHDTLWSGTPRQLRRDHAPEIYRKAQALALQGKCLEAETLLEKDFTSEFGQSYLPVGSIYIENENASEPKEYLRTLDMEKGIVSVRYEANGNFFTREYFVSHPDRCICVRIRSEKPATHRFSAECPLKNEISLSENELILTGEAPVSISPSYAMNLYPMVYNGKGMRFTAIAHIETDGKVSIQNEKLTVSNATDTVLTICIATSFIDFKTMPTGDHDALCREALRQATKASFEDRKAAHISDFSGYYNRVSLSLDLPASSLPTDERIRSKDKSDDLALAVLLFNFGRYLTIAGSREGSEAMNLQGIWNEEVFAPWSSNYTVNINAEMNYWPTLMCDLAGLDLPIVALTEKISVTGAETARDFYDAKGYCAHHNIDLWGLSTPVGAQSNGCIQYAFWNMSAGWLCRHVFEHYEYTMDKEYLEKTAYPLMKGAAEFYLSLLIEHKGKYIMSPSTSPENRYYDGEHRKTALAKYTAMSQGIVMDLFENVSRAASVLAIEDDFVREIREKLPLLQTYEIGAEGQLIEFDGEMEEVDIRHRHTSHLYGLYPGESITLEKTPALAEACRQTLLRRGDESTGWSMGWRVNLWAKLGDGNHALKLVKNQLNYVDPTEKRTWKGGGSYPNLFDAHPPFQIDGNFGVCSGIAQMFLQSENGKIKILPALPDAFQNGSVSGLKAKGNISVDIVFEAGKLKSFSLRSPIAQTADVVTPYGEYICSLSANEAFSLQFPIE